MGDGGMLPEPSKLRIQRLRLAFKVVRLALLKRLEVC